MFADLPADELNPERFVRAVPLLTLDVVRPLYSRIGLPTEVHDGLQRVLRGEMVNGRRRFQTNPNQLPATPAGVLEAIESALGYGCAKSMAWWIKHIFHCTPTDNNHLRRWVGLLRHCRHQPQLWERIGLPDSLWQEALGRFLRSINIDEFNQLYEDASTRPLSDWDLHLYAIYFYDDDDSEGTPNGPCLWLTPTVRDFQAYQFWAWILRTLQQDQVDSLWESSCKLAVEEGFLPAKELPHPSILDIGL